MTTVYVPGTDESDHKKQNMSLQQIAQGLATAPPAAVAAAAGTAVPIIDGVAAVGTSAKWAHEDHVHPTDTSRAALASPALTGTPTAPTAAVDTNTTQLASTAFVVGQASASGDGTPAIDGTASRGTSTHFARADHVHPTDTSRAALASPALTGTPTAPTAAVGTNTTQLATTAFVQANGITHTAGGVGSFAVGNVGGTDAPLNAAGSTYSGTWQKVSSDFTSGVTLWQRTA